MCELQLDAVILCPSPHPWKIILEIKGLQNLSPTGGDGVEIFIWEQNDSNEMLIFRSYGELDPEAYESPDSPTGKGR